MYALIHPSECRVYFREYGKSAFPTYQEFTDGTIAVQSVAVMGQFGPYPERPGFIEALQEVLEDAGHAFGSHRIEGYELVLANPPDFLLSDLKHFHAHQEVGIRA